MIADILLATLMLLGALFMLVAAVGVLRFADLFQRLHASSKAATLGAALLLAGAALSLGDLGTVSRCIMAVIFFMVSAPVGAHLIARAAADAGEPLAPTTLSDERPD